MKIVAQLTLTAAALVAIFHFGLPQHASTTNLETYSVELAAVALLALAASLYIALKRMK